MKNIRVLFRSLVIATRFVYKDQRRKKKEEEEEEEERDRKSVV